MKWFNNLSVLVRLLAGFIFVAILAALVGVVGISNLNNIAKADMDLYKKATLSVQYAGSIATMYQKQRVYLRDILRTNDTAVMRKSKEGIKVLEGEVKKELALYRETTSTDEGIAMHKELSSAYDDLVGIVYEIADLSIDNKKKEVDIKMVAPRTLEILARIEKAVNDVLSRNIEFAKETSIANEKLAKQGTMVMIGVIAGAVVFALFLGILISVSIKGPISKGLAFAQKIAAGDFTGRIDLDQKDELGRLGKALNLAADDLEKMVSDIVVGSQNLTQAIREISAGNENLSQRTTEQASSLEEVASTIEETTASIGANADNARSANDLSNKTTILAEEGGRVVYEAVNAINEINDASKKIESIISVINEISFQTNLLALNAAVEAARAGEQGRGFAVVAGEVRNLAQRSGSAAKEIGELIKSTIVKVDKGTSLSNKSGEALKEIIESVKNVGRLVSEINAASEEQKQGAQQINVAISELDSMTQQNAGLVEETASASEEMSNQAQELLATMEKFKIRNALVDETAAIRHKEIHLRAADKMMTKRSASLTATQAKPSPTKIEHDAERKDISVQGAVPRNQNEIDTILSKDGFEQF